MLISEIKVENRHRQDLGDIDGLAASIATLGLLHPLVVNGDGKLIAGERRMEAVKKLGWSEVPVTVVKSLGDIEKAIRAERDENTCRKDFTPSEAVAMAEALAPFEKKAAAEKRESTQGRPKTGEKFTPVSPAEEKPKQKAMDRVAEAVGMSRPTLAKAKAVVEAAKADPKNFGDLPAKMDKTGKVDPVHQELVKRAEMFPLPKGPTPAQIAKNNAGVKWAKNMHECWVQFNSIRDNGGLAKLAAGWDSHTRLNYLDELRMFKDAVEKCITELEKANGAR